MRMLGRETPQSGLIQIIGQAATWIETKLRHFLRQPLPAVHAFKAEPEIAFWIAPTGIDPCPTIGGRHRTRRICRDDADLRALPAKMPGK